MVAVAGLSSVESRIGRIEQRLGLAEASSSVAADLLPPDTTGFDPFGAAYQQALTQVQQLATPVAAATYASGMRLQSAGGDVLAAPAASFSTAGVTGSSVGRIGGYGPITVPAELVGHGNGRIPNGVLSSIGQGGHVLWGPAADAWRGAVEAAAADGVTLRVTDSYRTYDQQVDLAERKGLYADGGLAAVPGTSNHGWGMAVDVDVSDPATLSWIRTNGYRFGFVEAVPREPWHWEFRPHQA